MDPSLKQRLIGAAAVVSLIVIFVPMLFDEAPEQAGQTIESIPALPEAIEERPIALPRVEAERAMEAAAPPPSTVAPKPDVKARPNGFKIIPLDDPPAQRKTPSDVAKPAVELAVPRELAPESPAVAAVDEPPAEPEAPPAEAKPPAEPGAKSRRAPLERAPVKPKPVAPAGEKPKSKPTETTAATEPTKVTGAKTPTSRKAPKAPPSTWIVQTGSFTGEANAKMLAERLRKADLPAYVETSKGDSGTLFRVQVGPELNRGRAEQIQKQIERSFGIKGMIVSRN